MSATGLGACDASDGIPQPFLFPSRNMRLTITIPLMSRETFGAILRNGKMVKRNAIVSNGSIDL